MKTQQNKVKSGESGIGSFAEFRKRFYPKSVNQEGLESADPEEFGEKLAKESLKRLRSVLEPV